MYNVISSIIIFFSSAVPSFGFSLEIKNCYFMVLCSSATASSVGGSNCSIQFRSLTEAASVSQPVLCVGCAEI